jgi:hypothetical protein
MAGRYTQFVIGDAARRLLFGAAGFLGRTAGDLAGTVLGSAPGHVYTSRPTGGTGGLFGSIGGLITNILGVELGAGIKRMGRGSVLGRAATGPVAKNWRIRLGQVDPWGQRTDGGESKGRPRSGDSDRFADAATPRGAAAERAYSPENTYARHPALKILDEHGFGKVAGTKLAELNA